MQHPGAECGDLSLQVVRSCCKFAAEHRKYLICMEILICLQQPTWQARGSVVALEDGVAGCPQGG